MWDKEFEEFETFEGLTIPNGIERVQRCDYNEECALGCTSCADYEKAGCVGSGITKIDCTDCLCYADNKEFLEKYLQQKTIKSGMVVQTKDNDYCLVERVSDEGIYGWSVWHNVTDQGRSLCELRDYRYFMRESIRAVYKLKSGGSTNAVWRPSGDSIRRLTSRSDHWERLWEEIDPPVLELTVKDIEEKYGRKVKIVGE